MKSVVLFSFKKLPQGELGLFVNNVITKMTADAQFLTLMVYVQALKVLYDAFQVAMVNAADGGKLNTLAKDTKKKEMVDQLELVARYVNILANGDSAVILTAGLVPSSNERTPPVTVLLPPASLEGSNVGGRTGVASLKWPKVEGAKFYEPQVCKKDTNVWVSYPTSGALKTDVTGLEANTLYLFRVVACTVSGVVSDPSPVVEVLVS